MGTRLVVQKTKERTARKKAQHKGTGHVTKISEQNFINMGVAKQK